MKSTRDIVRTGMAFLAVVIALHLSLPVQPAHGSNASQEKKFTFGVVPQFTPRQIAEKWIPVLKELEKRTGYEFELQGSTTIPDFEKKFMAGRFDFAYMNPYHSLVALEEAGYQPLIRDGSKRLFGVLVVHKDSPVKSLSDLEGETIGFPAPNALGASLMTRAVLKDQDVNFDTKYLQTHSSVYLNVATGRVAAGGGVMRTFNSQPAEIRDRLKIIYRTVKVSPHPVTAHPDVSVNDVALVRQAFLDMANSEEGRAILGRVPIKEPVDASASDYHDLKTMNLERFYEKAN